MSHRARAPDGLDVKLFTLNDGGKNMPTFRDGWYFDADGTKVIQKMQYPTGHPKEGVKKGLKTVLRERGKHLDDNGRDLRLICKPCSNGTRELDGTAYSKCCATYVASKEPDFQAQKSYLTEVIESEGFNIIFYPKYHCELNYIELVWGWIKRYHRDNCTYNFRDLERDLPRTVEEHLPLRFVRRAARRVLRYAEGYRLNKIGRFGVLRKKNLQCPQKTNYPHAKFNRYLRLMLKEYLSYIIMYDYFSAK